MKRHDLLILLGIGIVKGNAQGAVAMDINKAGDKIASLRIERGIRLDRILSDFRDLSVFIHKRAALDHRVLRDDTGIFYHRFHMMPPVFLF